MIAAPTANRAGQRRIASTTRTARTRCTFRYISSTATGRKATIARATSGRLPDSHQRQPSRRPIQATLKAADSVKAIYQLHKNVRTDSENNTNEDFIANLDEKCEGNYIKMSVDPQGTEYTITIPARKFERTYQTKGR